MLAFACPAVIHMMGKSRRENNVHGTSSAALVFLIRLVKARYVATEPPFTVPTLELLMILGTILMYLVPLHYQSFSVAYIISKVYPYFHTILICTTPPPPKKTQTNNKSCNILTVSHIIHLQWYQALKLMCSFFPDCKCRLYNIYDGTVWLTHPPHIVGVMGVVILGPVGFPRLLRFLSQQSKNVHGR